MRKNPKALNLELLEFIEKPVTLGFKINPDVKLRLARDAKKSGMSLSMYVNNILTDKHSFFKKELQELYKSNQMLTEKIKIYEKNKYMIERELYVTAATNFANRYGYKDVTPHIIDVMVSIMMTKDNVQQGGSFVQAICSNDLHAAISAADSQCLNYIRLMSLTNQFCNIQNKGL
jgi:hypothetical protein